VEDLIAEKASAIDWGVKLVKGIHTLNNAQMHAVPLR
jgi:hypothetical protein